ncbi:MAG: peptide deformylase [Bacteroidales bacterium]|nr:peptide deformylase [Candidatus Cryptobacteroides choladohippi]
MRKLTAILAPVLMLGACCTNVNLTMTPEEIKLIDESSDVMRILTTDNAEDLAVLRSQSRDFSLADIETVEYRNLASKLITTLQSTDGGVGLAAPQVGIKRRVVAVQRVDKEGEPIEVYPNIRIEEFRGELQAGPEGCLSVPDRRGEVLRSQDITIVYTDASLDQPREIREDVSGFAAVIFQHEVDHLDGILYIDKLQ